MGRFMIANSFGMAVASLLVFARLTSSHAESPPSQSQTREYQANVPKTILELQQFRQSNSIRIRSKAGREGTATLVNLNPTINAWYVLMVGWKDGAPEIAYHLENPAPEVRRLLMDDQYPAGLVLAEGKRRSYCELFGAGPVSALDAAKASPLIFSPLCEGQLYLRNPALGHRTSLEAATEFLRDHVWGGENIVALGHILMGEIHREPGKLEPGSLAAPGATNGPGRLPFPARVDSKYADRLLMANNLGLNLERAGKSGMIPGAWYATSGNPGIYVSILQPNLIDTEILRSYRTRVNNLDNVEAGALCYLIAFDLDRFELGYALGTEHPGVGWSGRVPESMKDPKLPGPDGIGSISPLIATGLVSPQDARKTVATFTGGFKRTHGAFRYGELALRNHGSHYGFIENGVVFSKLQPGLATIFVLEDGSMEMKTWTEGDNQLLARIKHARQNGVPLIEFDQALRSLAPGALVSRWGDGNWSGSEAKNLRTMRAGVALQKNGGKRFLIYAVFSDATPSAMARMFQAYACDYAMLLDMNALEHTYLAVYRRDGSQLFVDHLIKAMSVLEKSASGELVPRFIGYADNRDFFYLTRRNEPEVKP